MGLYQVPHWIDPPLGKMPAPVVGYHPDGAIRFVEYHNTVGKKHRTDGPARIDWHENGVIRQEEWHVAGKMHRLDGPAMTQWHSHGQVKSESWYKNDNLHRVDEPATVSWDADGKTFSKGWYVHGHYKKSWAKDIGKMGKWVA